MWFTPSTNISPKTHQKALWNKALRWHREYEDYVVRIFMEGLRQSLPHHMHSFLHSKKNSTIHDLVLNEASVAKFQHGLHNNNTTGQNDQTVQQRGNTGCGRRSAYNIIVMRNSILLAKSFHGYPSNPPSWPLQQQIWYGTISRKKPCNRFKPHPQWDRSTTRQSAVFVWLRAIQSSNTRTFYIKSVPHQSNLAEPTSSLFRYPSDGSPEMLFSDRHPHNSNQHKRPKVWWTLTKCTAPTQPKNTLPNRHASRACATTPSCQNITARAKGRNLHAIWVATRWCRTIRDARGLVCPMPLTERYHHIYSGKDQLAEQDRPSATKILD